MVGQNNKKEKEKKKTSLNKGYKTENYFVHALM